MSGHILITGANRGLGDSVARAALADGWKVTGTSRGAPCTAGIATLTLDVTDTAALKTSFAALEPVDILINNAGIFHKPPADPLETSLNTLAETFAVNAFAPLMIVQALMPKLRKPGGKILSISSDMSKVEHTNADGIAYRASKTALNKLMQGLATELRPMGIPVCVINPGWVRTDMGGENAALDPDQVGAGIWQVAQNLDMECSGKILSWQGVTDNY